MPFRHFYARLGAKHPVAYSNLTLVAGMLAVMAITCWLSISVTVRAEKQARERAEQTEAQSRERSRIAACVVAQRMVDVYSDPETDTGRKAREAWLDLRRIFQCDNVQEAQPR